MNDHAKNCAKTCIASRNYPEAVSLYSKAVELERDSPALAILHANRSMCYLNMSKGAEALVDADEAVRLDPAYIKGYYRLAMAHSLLHQFAQAKQALERGLARKPEDKELSAQLVKVQERIVAEEANHTPIVESKASTSAKSVSVSAKSAPSSSSSAKAATKTAAKEDNNKDKEEDEDEDLKNLNVRGYKKTADGKVTTFFNNELDEQTKALIGSIAPKKLDAQGEVITTNVAPSSGSAWNAAGTYEEKVLTAWANEHLRALFASRTLSVAGEEVHPQAKALLPDMASLQIEVSLSAAEDALSGHAQVTMLRGKKKHVCDYTLSLKWSLLATFADADKSPLSVQGSLSVLDITADREFEIDQVAVSSYNDANASLYTLPKEAAVLVGKYVRESDRGVQKMVFDALNAFWDELKTK